MGSPEGPLGVLVGARVRRVDVPAADLVAITLLIERETTTFLVSVSESAPGIGVADERPRGEPAASFAQLLRKYLKGSAIERVTSPAQGELHVVFRRDEERTTLHVGVRRRSGGVVLIDGEGRALGGAPRGIASNADGARGPADVHEWPRDLDELRVAGLALLARRAGEGDRDRNRELRRALVKARSRVERRVRAIEGDLAATSAATGLRADGSLLLASLAGVPAHASEVALVDPETEATRTIALDPTRSATDNAERFFVKARKLGRGARIATLRLADAQRELARYDAALSSLSAGDVAPAETLTQKPSPKARTKAAEAPLRRVPYRTFGIEDGSVILVGRGARDNDALTFRTAAPDDLFFHARGHTGAHVILRVLTGHPPSDAARVGAATLAAHFSASRGDTAVDVSVATRRDLRRGKAAGSVVMRASSTQRVRMDQDAIAALLARETKT